MMRSSAAMAAIDPTDEQLATPVRVLVVDDDPLVLQSLKDWFEARPGVTACGFTSAEEAMASSAGAFYDVCLLDYRLEGLDGVMLGAMIRALNPAARLILMSGVVNPQIERQAIEHGFHTVLAKPFAPRRLEQLVLSDVEN